MKKATLFFILAALVYSNTNAQNSPILIRPPNTTIMASLTPTLEWQSVSGASSYEVWISTDPNFSFTITQTIPTVTTTQLVIPSGWFDPGTTYYWEVREISPATGNFSAASCFTTGGSSIQDINQLTSVITCLVNNSQLPASQGNILNNRLERATDQLELNHPFNAIVQMLIFKLRVFIDQNSNLLTPASEGDVLQDYADNVIGTISNGNFVIPPVSSLSNAHNMNLTQNYPNPFNPTTNIEYTITERSMVTLKIYDILGKEVSTLVNKEQDAGTYVAVWNASNFSSGIYFYRLNAGNFVQTKRMILNK